MDLLTALNHLLNFAAPALVQAMVLVLGSRVFMKKTAAALSWWSQVAIVFVVGCGVLVAGLWWLGRDGKVLTYAALVLATATCQWLLRRGWRA